MRYRTFVRIVESIPCEMMTGLIRRHPIYSRIYSWQTLYRLRRSKMQPQLSHEDVLRLYQQIIKRVESSM